MITQKQKDALRSLLSGSILKKGQDWLISAHIDSKEGSGWPHRTDQKIPTVWGATIDGIRGMIAAGASRFDPVIQNSVMWLVKQQRENGGLGSREIVFSSVEATAWVVIMFKEAGLEGTYTTELNKALGFLGLCIRSSGEVATSENDEDTARTYPAILSLWGLDKFSDKANLVARFLKDTRDPLTGGWGIKPKVAPNPLSTSQVAYILLKSGHLAKEDIITRQAVDYLLRAQKEDGSWDNFTETWFSVYQSHVSLRCEEYTTTWALNALLSAGLSPTSDPVTRAISSLIYAQNEIDGYWPWNLLDDAKNIWSTSDAMVSLSNARRILLETITSDKIENLWQVNNDLSNQYFMIPKYGLSSVINFLRDNLTGLIVVLLSVYTFRAMVNNFIQGIVNYFQVEGNQVISSLIGSLIYGVLILLGTILLNRIRRERK